MSTQLLLTESLWSDGQHPDWALYPIIGGQLPGATNRKLRLLAAARCRRVWHLLDEHGRAAVEAAERYADGLIDAAALAAVRAEAVLAAGRSYLPSARARWTVRVAAGRPAAAAPHGRVLSGSVPSSSESGRLWGRERGAFDVVDVPLALEGTDDDRAAHRRLLHDVFGDPFRPAGADPAWLLADDGLIPKLAQAIYDEPESPSGRLDVTRLSILGDALEEAGCTGAVLGHCREGGVHVRGCWVLDLLLGRE
jgi:hypothetical protein